LSAVAVVVAVLIASLAAWLSARALARGSLREARALDDTGEDLRKVHVSPTPRIGGVAVVAGLLAAVAASCALSGALCPWALLVVCAAPAFAWGLIEDFSKRGAWAVRYALTAFAAALGFILADARITQLHVPGLDPALAIPAVSFVFTVFAVTGVAHSFNLIDGLNGLAGLNALLGAIGLAIVAASVGDSLVLPAACALAASVAGFLLVNYPRGRIFLGDGGAYLVGLLLAELAVLLVHRNSEVSPWFPLILLAYPIWETLFTVYRRKARGHSTARADALHLHSLVYRRIVRWRSFEAKPSDYVMRNSIASLCLWVVPAACLAVALAFWDTSLPLQAAAAVFGISYTLAYRRLVHFGVPSRLVLRAKPQSRRQILAANALLGDNAITPGGKGN
jgi:UDP-N-acetylmuramyl pentapeptide phosphotransferase/UDP-N-acetylglucosamine-1-phosphate transferase